ncbi:hypothetical protein IV203_013775 [Nitzschia inconspicua]|uniref:Uncharacterized protein n=1 Tax=Nitzschia inconspicua TaxID=303405 RepID=A0A9K3Q925_9STRA|nr:hypothetical protein IV203_013775 [Nitzschia inconspicua]
MTGVFVCNNSDPSKKTNCKEDLFPSSSYPDAMTETPTLSDVTEDDDVIRRPDISVERALRNAADGVQDLATVKSKSRLVQSEHWHQVYTDPENLSTMEQGGAIFSFVCNHELTNYEASMVDAVINLSAFEDEQAENGVPYFEYAEYEKQRRQIEAEKDRSKRKSEYSNSSSPSSSSSSSLSKHLSKTHPNYTFLLARCSYLLTGFSLDDLLANPQIIATFDYQQSCQPSGTKIWDDFDKMDTDTFRMTKPIIPYIYSFTVQFHVSRVHDPKELQELSRVLHIPVDGVIVLERTKRSKPPKEDATRKIKSVLVYTDLGDGVVLVTHLTILLQVGLPEVIERIIGTIGQWGLGETAETAWRTRHYLQTRLPYASDSFLDANQQELKMVMTEKTVEHKDSLSFDDEDDDFFDAMDDGGAHDVVSGVANLVVN